MEIRRCMKCMHELKAGETVCPECGEVYGNWKTEPFALKPGTILEGKYLVGQMLGQGGFGITYIGFDLLLEQKVAIKEYFPMSTGMVSRENSTSVIWNAAMTEKGGVQTGFDSFLKEARKMAKLGEIPGVVGVKSVFIQNETAYIVMDFIEGETLLKKLEREGPMDFDTCVSLLTPIMEALAEVHQHGIIHRDISPDNIMVRNDGKLILLDLGAAKDLEIRNADGTVQSSQLVAKCGFSPVEQYGRGGKIGPWTDVYAMAATIYYCCTGCLPPASTDRISDDPLVCKPHLTKGQFDVLRICMTILPEQRPQDMTAMLRIVSHARKTGSSNTRTTKPALPKWLIPTAAAGIAVLGIAIGIGIGAGSGKGPRADTVQNTAPKTIAPIETILQTETTLPRETTSPTEETTLPTADTALRTAQTLYDSGKFREAAQIIAEARSTDDRPEFTEMYIKCCRKLSQPIIAAGGGQSVRIRENGTVASCGENMYGQCDVDHWTNVITVAAGDWHTVGLCADGKVYAVGNNERGQCNTSAWHDVVSLCAGDYHTLGITSDGTILVAGDTLSPEDHNWLEQGSKIIDAAAGYHHSVFLRENGTVSAIGENGYGQCEVSGWTDIVAICAGTYHTVGLKSDGTVVAAGEKKRLTFNGNFIDGYTDVSGWKDIVAISAGDYYTMGLKADGTVVAVGHNDDGQIETSSWHDIIAIAGGGRHSIGLMSDGTVVATGTNSDGRCNTHLLSE